MARAGAAPVWNGAAYAAFRRSLAEGPPPQVCSSCALCHGTF
jgi:hypothetical protein